LTWAQPDETEYQDTRDKVSYSEGSQTEVESKPEVGVHLAMKGT